MRLTILCIAAASLSACVEGLADSRITSRDWALIGAKRTVIQPEVWCYRTTAKPDCYLAPLPDQTYRLIEHGPTSTPQNFEFPSVTASTLDTGMADEEPIFSFISPKSAASQGSKKAKPTPVKPMMDAMANPTETPAAPPKAQPTAALKATPQLEITPMIAPMADAPLDQDDPNLLYRIAGYLSF